MKIILLLLSLSVGFGCASQSTLRNEWLGADKVLHFGISTALAAAVTRHELNRGRSDCDARRIGFTVSISAGALKELYDKKIKKTFWSFEDMGWDLLGATVGSVAASDC